METKESPWNILTEGEKKTLLLAHGHGKSSWKAGEILEKSHYKYLEQLKRAQKFLELFTGYYDKYPSLFHSGLSAIPFSFKEYISYTILERRKPTDIYRLVSDPRYQLRLFREPLILETMALLKLRQGDQYSDLYNLILDYDRWNNQRILPQEIQEPSAYPRRSKNLLKNHIKKISSLPLLTIHTLIDKISTKSLDNVGFIALINKDIEGGYILSRVNLNDSNIKRLNELGVYLFETETQAVKFGQLLAEYINPKNKGNALLTPVKRGRIFWIKFRAITEHALNSDDINTKTRKRSNLDRAFQDNYTKAIKKKVIQKGGILGLMDWDGN